MENFVKDHNYEKLKDQFTSTTRVVRRNLLVASALSIILFSIGGEISTLFGVNFGKNVPIDLPLGALCIVVIYEFVTFVTYGFIDYKSWSLKPSEITHTFSEDMLKVLNEDVENIKNEVSKKIKMKHFEFPKVDKVSIEFEAMPMPVPDSLPEILDSEMARELENRCYNRISKHIEEESIKAKNKIKNEANNFLDELKEQLKDKTNEIDFKLTEYIKNLESIDKEINTHISNIISYRKGIKKMNYSQRFRIYFIDWLIPIAIGISGIYLNFSSISFLYDMLMSKIA